ncbi:monocarboxylate transporter 12-like [Haliotis rufescens]|uniref:monocarboxylate transporter 12-like n=1 Tax=Haliotis rufescens TaxID=6454 RepID=UPI00201F4BEC|nr:monocarboxylate transporter 12-like [Haliotis rufescens]
MEINNLNNTGEHTDRHDGNEPQSDLSRSEDSYTKTDGLEMQSVDLDCDNGSPTSVVSCHSGTTQAEPGSKHKQTEATEKIGSDDDDDDDDDDDEGDEKIENLKLMRNTQINKEPSESNEEEEDNNLPIDRGWAWVVLVGCFLIVFLMVGYGKGIAILFVEYVHVFDVPASKATLFFGVITGAYSIASVFTMHILVGVLGIRKTVLLGVTLNVIGMTTAIFATSITYLICTHSILMGVSNALIHSPCLVILGHYFKKRRGWATTVSVSGVSLGGMVFPPLIRFLLDTYALRGTMIILTGISMNMWIGALLLRPLESFRTTKKIRESRGDEKEKEPAAKEQICIRLTKRLHLDFTLFKKPLFQFIICFGPWAILVALNGAYLPSLAMEKGISKTDTAMLLTIFNAVDFLSRLCLGAVVDRKYVKVYHLMAIGLFITGTVNQFTWFYHTFLHLLLFTVISGLFGSFHLCLIPVAVVEFMGLEDMGKTLGFMAMFHGISGFITHPIIGILRDATGTYDACFNYTGTCVYIGAIVLLFSPLVIRFDKNRRTIRNHIESGL